VQQSAPEQLPELPGINVAECVRRIGGNVSLYLSLLDKFRDNQRDFASNFREALAAGDRATAERLVHTLKGIAGTLGAETLQDSADILEKCVKNNESGEIDTRLASVDTELAAFIAIIDRALEARRA
jgi:HPt (histidine-containing phosphotransfer) domain-containing protein